MANRPHFVEVQEVLLHDRFRRRVLVLLHPDVPEVLEVLGCVVGRRLNWRVAHLRGADYGVVCSAGAALVEHAHAVALAHRKSAVRGQYLAVSVVEVGQRHLVVVGEARHYAVPVDHGLSGRRAFCDALKLLQLPA